MRYLLVLSALVLTACGKTPELPPLSATAGNPSTFTGSYTGDVQGTQNSQPFVATITLTVNQTSDVLTGTYVVSTGDSGTLGGVASSDNSSITVQLASTHNGCLDQMTVELYPTATGLAGAIWGTNTPCGTLGSAAKLIRQ